LLSEQDGRHGLAPNIASPQNHHFRASFPTPERMSNPVCPQEFRTETGSCPPNSNLPTLRMKSHISRPLRRDPRCNSGFGYVPGQGACTRCRERSDRCSGRASNPSSSSPLVVKEGHGSPDWMPKLRARLFSFIPHNAGGWVSPARIKTRRGCTPRALTWATRREVFRVDFPGDGAAIHESAGRHQGVKSTLCTCNTGVRASENPSLPGPVTVTRVPRRF